MHKLLIHSSANSFNRRLYSITKTSEEIRKHFQQIDLQKGKIEIPQKLTLQKKPIPNIKHIICISSGKGGVGKSSVTVNLASSLLRKGKKVGILDADIYGPSIPRLLGLQNANEPESVEEEGVVKMKSLNKYGLECMSIGFMVPESKPIAWRGMMLTKALNQLLFQTKWPSLEYLLIDLPPGTGDVPMTIGQQCYLSGAILVGIGSQIAYIDVLKGKKMFDALGVNIIGRVDNMSSIKCPNCHHSHSLFQLEHEKLDKELPSEQLKDVKLLAEIPFDQKLLWSCDEGVPIVLRSDCPPQILSAYTNIAEEIISIFQ